MATDLSPPEPEKAKATGTDASVPLPLTAEENLQRKLQRADHADERPAAPSCTIATLTEGDGQPLPDAQRPKGNGGEMR